MASQVSGLEVEGAVSSGRLESNTMFDLIKKLGESLGWLANLFQVAGVLYLAVDLWRLRVKYKRRTRMLTLKPAQGAVALAVGVGTHIEAPVTKFLQQRFGSDDGRPKVPLVASFSESGFVPTTKFFDILRRIRDDVDELRKRGDIREVHFFYAGPYAIAVGVGAIVDNWVPVHVYMYNSKTSDYELAFTLSAETTKGH